MEASLDVCFIKVLLYVFDTYNEFVTSTRRKSFKTKQLIKQFHCSAQDGTQVSQKILFLTSTNTTIDVGSISKEGVHV